MTSSSSTLLMLLLLLATSCCSAFKIALFADLHFGENAWTDWGPNQDQNSISAMSSILDSEKPADFVVYLGDVLTANNMAVANASLYWDQAISPTRQRGIPWASVFGNHDDAPFEWPPEWFSAAGIPQLLCPPDSTGEDGCSFKATRRTQLMETEIKQNKLSNSKSGPKELWPSVSNYVVKVSLLQNSESATALLYFLDSGGGSYPTVISYAQMKWLQQQSAQMNPNSSLPELVFWHVPSEAYSKVAPAPGIPAPAPCVGSVNAEKVQYQNQENGMMEFLAGRPSVKAVFVGHNHGLDWCCPYEKLWLCFAKHTGYGGYGSWPRGARIIEITSNPLKIKSWIRMDDFDNSINSEVILSS